MINLKNFNMFKKQLSGDYWLKLSISEKLKILKELLDFDIRGEDDIKYLIWFLKLADHKEETRNFVSIAGIPSSGKNWIGSGVIKNLPKRILTFDSISKNALSRDKDLQSGKYVTIYYREYRRDTTITEDLKAGFDKETVRKVNEQDDHGRWVVKTLKTCQFGLLTTHSLDWIPVDLRDRCWSLTSDSSFEHTNEVIEFILENEQNKIERSLIEEEIVKKRKMVLNAIDNINWNLTPLIPYASKLKPLLSNKNIRIRRDTRKLVQLIHIITLVNQKNRFQKAFYDDFGVETVKYVISEPHDLLFALKIGKRFFLETIQNLDKVQIEILNQMDIKGKIKTDKWGTEILDNNNKIQYENYRKKDLKQFIAEKFSNETTNYKMKKHTEGLQNEGYIEIYEYGKGKASEYRKIKNFKNLDVDLQVNLQVLGDITDRKKTDLETKTIDIIKEEIKLKGVKIENE